jgi:tRNA (adenine22-N1)-methyltransferase
MKIGKRLTALEKLIPNGYTSIIDCCSDHGLLGMQLLKRNEPSEIVFNDIRQPIINRLQQRLNLIFSNKRAQWKTVCEDASQTLIPKTGKHLVVIAGVGGDKTIDLIRAILTNNPNSHFDLILCPVHHLYDVRQFLMTLHLGLVTELIVEENNRFYEIIYLSSHAEKKISITGNEQWQLDNDIHIKYLTQLINHYKRQSLDPNKSVTKKLISYQHLLSTLIKKV